MSKIVVNISLTLDGVMQAPGRPDEDTGGGFKYGGWATPYFDSVMGKNAAEGMAQSPYLLFGRRTYEDFYAVWPHRIDNPFTDVLNNSQKYVVSTTLKEPLVWQNSALLKDEAAIAKLKQQSDKDFVILGSGRLVQSLMKHNLIDTYVLSIHPLVLGSGSHLFTEGSPYASLRLSDTKITTSGVIVATYVPALSTADKTS